MIDQPMPRMEHLYQDFILDHYRHPRGRGLRTPFDAEVCHVNPVCGDEITLRIRLKADDPDADRPDDPLSRPTDVSYEARGCSISQAAASVMFDQVEGLPLREALATGDEFRRLMNSAMDPNFEANEQVLGDGLAFAGVARYPARIKCALLPWMALRDAAVQVCEVAHDAGGGR